MSNDSRSAPDAPPTSGLAPELSGNPDGAPTVPVIVAGRTAVKWIWATSTSDITTRKVAVWMCGSHGRSLCGPPNGRARTRSSRK